jgi:hypothetical protein
MLYIVYRLHDITEDRSILFRVANNLFQNPVNDTIYPIPDNFKRINVLL